MITKSRLSEIEAEASKAMTSALHEYCPEELKELATEVRRLAGFDEPPRLGMDFGEALFCMKAGKSVRRAAWDRMWLYMHLEEVQTVRRFVITDEAGSRVVVAMNNAMVLAEDWEEVDYAASPSGKDEDNG